jgi:hypothetical protein
MLSVSLLLIGALAAPAPKPPTPVTGPGAIKTMLEGLFQAIDAGDREKAKACLVGADCAFPVQVFDVDIHDRPVAIDGLDGAQKYLDAIFDALKKDGITVASKITKIHADCHSPELGYATLQFSQAFTQNGATESHDYRATVLVTWGKDQEKGPKIFHWHSSEARSAPAAAVPAAAPKK